MSTETKSAPDQLQTLAVALDGMAKSLAVLREQLDDREREALARRGAMFEELLRADTSRPTKGRPRKSLSGKMFKGVSVLEDLGTPQTGAVYRVRCSCGKEFLAAAAKLTRGEVISCGQCP